jgi:hypothetical protein
VNGDDELCLFSPSSLVFLHAASWPVLRLKRAVQSRDPR